MHRPCSSSVSNTAIGVMQEPLGYIFQLRKIKTDGNSRFKEIEFKKGSLRNTVECNKELFKCLPSSMVSGLVFLRTFMPHFNRKFTVLETIDSIWVFDLDFNLFLSWNE